MAVALSRAGYGSLDEIMQWTGYRMSQVMFIHGKLIEQEQKGLLGLHALASRGDPKEVQKMLRDAG